LADLPLLFHHFLKRHCRRFWKKVAAHPDVVELLSSHVWPATFRELENGVEAGNCAQHFGHADAGRFGDYLSSKKQGSTMFPGELFRWRKSNGNTSVTSLIDAAAT
jgi:DNA-binding NtrC family response regulator